MNMDNGFRDQDPSGDVPRVTKEGQEVLSLNQALREQKNVLRPSLSEQAVITLEMISRIIEGARTLAPVISLQPEIGEIIMARIFKQDESEPVQVQLAHDVYFEVTYDQEGNRIFSLRAQPKESPLVSQYVAELESAAAW